MSQSELATFAGGCFWCLEAVFERLRGVDKVVSGYTGGARANPTYEQVCSGATGHAEAVQLSFDPLVISYRDLVALFFAFHDPTTLDRQGPDIGTQYRSAIFTSSDVQAETARSVIAELEREGVFGRPIVTEVVPLTVFYGGEPGHQQYYQRNPEKAYCQAMIAPKVAKLRAKFAELLKG
ncbi:MAG TPA: peptide-methionine (S)-S-oxide reductase MsrA [Gemmatimonadales bacterium]|nr:peptide-methionine (S)-S-oxide reductase MsrA [Gemmatimonadales bacterium]